MAARSVVTVLGAALLAMAGGLQPAYAADMSVREITQALFGAAPGAIVDLSSKDLKELDLSELDFKAANLGQSDLYGADLSKANLSRAVLRNVRLDRATIIETDFSFANLTGATLLRPNVATSLAYSGTDAPNFRGANLTDAQITARFDGVDFRGANLTNVYFGPKDRRGDELITPRIAMMSCDFSEASLRGAKLSGAVLAFSKFVGADLRGADLTGANLSKADLTGARLDGAKLSGADLDGAVLSGAHGLDLAIGLSDAVNLDKARR